MELNLKTQQNKLISLFRVSLMFFLFFFVQQTVASSQSITLPSHNITIKDAFSEIEKQTGMSVDYDESVINLNKQVNASVNNKSLNETLALILKESGCTFVIRNNHIIISAQTVQQQQKQVTISGTVSDNLGPIAGANVVEKGTTNGIITDMDGNYTLSVPQGAVIQFSYIGYVTKEITVDSQKNINVQLAEKTGFSEEDADTVKECLRTLFVNDASSARPDGSMEVVKLFWWRHSCKDGQYSSAKVHRSVKVALRDAGTIPTSADDYVISLEALPGLEPEVIDGV